MPTKFDIYIYITRFKKNIILLIYMYVEVCLRHSLQQNYNTLVFYCFMTINMFKYMYA
jgi:hypothetical protein